ncbi:MAG: sugar kinase [Spirochaetaceae bacterium]|nr:sugar kinase [Spirochaetaceae bacterium]
MPLLCCADIGTSALKAALIDTAGVLHGYCRFPYEAKRSPLVWLSAFTAALQDLARQCPGVKASAFIASGNGPTLVPVTAGGESLEPLYWFDPVQALEGPSFFLPHVKALKDRDPGGFAKTRFFFSPQEWLSWHLGAQALTVLPHRSYEPFYWDGAQCRFLGIDPQLFPPFTTMGRIIGRIRKKNSGAGEDGSGLLPPGIPIVAGASDFIMALIGTGVLLPGMVCNRTGSSEGINVSTAERPAGMTGNLRILPHAIEGLWNAGAVIEKSGKLLEDFRSATYGEKPYDILVEEILKNPLHPGRKAMDAIGISFLKALEDLERAGFPVQELVISGSQGRNSLWNQHKADLSGRIFKVPEIPDAELGGNAVLGALALERGPDAPGVPDGTAIRKKAAEMIRIRKIYYPTTPPAPALPKDRL